MGSANFDPMAPLNNLNTLIMNLQSHAATIGLTLAGLMIGFYAMMIMLTPETSATRDRGKWDNLQKVLICAAIIAGTGTFLQFAQGIGQHL